MSRLSETPHQLLAESSQEEQEALQLLTVKEYADLTRVHVQTVYTAIRNGRLPQAIVRPTSRTIRIAVSRGSIQALTHT